MAVADDLNFVASCDKALTERSTLMRGRDGWKKAAEFDGEAWGTCEVDPQFWIAVHDDDSCDAAMRLWYSILEYENPEIHTPPPNPASCTTRGTSVYREATRRQHLTGRGPGSPAAAHPQHAVEVYAGPT